MGSKYVMFNGTRYDLPSEADALALHRLCARVPAHWIGWLVCILLAIGTCLWAASGCIAPQYHLHVGEKHFHQQGAVAAEGDPVAGTSASDVLMGMYEESGTSGVNKASK